MLRRKAGPSRTSNKQGSFSKNNNNNNHHAFYGDDTNKYHHHNSGGDVSPRCVCRWLVRFVLLLVVAFFISLLVVQEEVLEKEVEHVVQLKRRMIKYNQTLTKENTALQQHEKTLQEESNQSKTLLQAHVSDLEHRLSETNGKIQLLCKRLLLEKYGPGPHYVEVQLRFDPESSNVVDGTSNNNNKFVIQLAPFHEMPHSTFWFLEQVTKGLYDGTSFYRNTPKTLRGGGGGPPSEQQQQAATIKKRFHDQQLDGLLFPEYSEDFPHVEHTVGYIGNGPEIFINLSDNTKLYGPGGAGVDNNNNAVAASYPCFGKIVDGLDAVERLHRSETTTDDQEEEEEESGGEIMKHSVAIVHMKFLGQPTQPRVGGYKDYITIK